jgi:hypothetical protein
MIGNSHLDMCVDGGNQSGGPGAGGGPQTSGNT